MEDRFPRGLLIAVGAATILVLIIGAVGLWEEGGPSLLPRDHLDRLEKEAKSNSSPAAGTPADPGDRNKVPPPVRPSRAAVVATLKRLGASPTASPKPRPERPLTNPFALPALPEVNGRIRVVTEPRDGGVASAQVAYGAPLQFEVKRAGDSGSQSEIRYHGRGRHLRIVAFLTRSGARVIRVLHPQSVGGETATFTITPPGTLAGRVTGPDGQPVQGAAVQVDNSVGATGADGRFRLTDVRGRQVAVYVTAPRHAPHREVLTTPERFGTAGAPAFEPVLKLQAGVRMTVNIRYPESSKPPASGYVFHFIPFGHRLPNQTLAVEKLGPLQAESSGSLVVSDFPVGQEMCLVGLHPEWNLIYHRLSAASTDLNIALKARPRSVVTGTVRRTDTNQPVAGLRIESSLDGVTTADYLGSTRKIPTGHQHGDFPLPTIDLPLLDRRVGQAGAFRIVVDSVVKPQVALRFKGPDLETRTVMRGGLSPRLDLDLTPKTNRKVKAARILLTVNLAGAPKIASLRVDGLEAGTPTITGPGRAEVALSKLPLGQYELKVEAEGYEPYTRTLSISTASTQRCRRS